MKFQAIKGVRDILPPDSALWNRVEQAAREVFATYGYGEIRLPIFEPTELFERSVGAHTDIVNKELYTFFDPFDRLRHYFGLKKTSFGKFEEIEELPDEEPGEISEIFVEVNDGSDKLPLKGKLLSLRPEGTASTVRAYIERGLQTRPGSVKLYYIGPMFRRERPQKGRYRQFYQIGAELLGPSDDAGLDAEIIEMLLAFFDRIQLKGTVLDINSVGDKNCRPAYIAQLRAALEKVRDKLGPDSQRRIETNPLRVLDSKLPDEQPVIAGLPHIADHLCDDCRKHYADLKRHLDLRGIAYQENWRLVRGLDYYMRTAFEITAPGLGSQNAVCGGGRYDGLVELLGGPPTKGIGFAIGTDRLILSLQEAGAGTAPSSIDVYIAWLGAATYPAAVALAKTLRLRGIAVEMPAAEMKFGKSLGLADRLGARYAVILGEDELAAKQFTVKRLADGEQKKLSEPELIAYLTEAGPRV